MDFSPVSFIEGLISVLEKLSEKIWPGLDTTKSPLPATALFGLDFAKGFYIRLVSISILIAV